MQKIAECSCGAKITAEDKQNYKKLESFKAEHRSLGHKVKESGGVQRGK